MSDDIFDLDDQPGEIKIPEPTKTEEKTAAIPTINPAAAAGVVLFIVLTALGMWGYTQLETQKISYDSKISGLETKVLHLQNVVAQNQKTTSDQIAQNSHIQEIHQKSQDQLLTDAVSKTAASVVSVVISKDVPKLSVTYQNPFGNDPYFKDFGFRVPVYQQNGVEHQKIGAGTGFIITSDGYIVTNKHVAYDDSADYTALLSNGKQLPARVIYKDSDNDIAILKIDGKGFSKVSLGDSGSLKLGQTVIAIGNALGQYDNSVSVGILSGLNRQITASGSLGSETLDGVIQTDAAINPGNSGGPLIDLNGNVIGVNVATVQGSSNISFSIPINTVKAIIKQALNQ